MPGTLLNRRRFLAYLAASPLLHGEIDGPLAALNVLDFEAVAKKVLPPAHFGYLATGVDGDETLQANRDGFKRIQLRPRRLVDISHSDLRIELFGTTWDSPIGLAPIGNQMAFHPEGEMPVLRAAKVKATLQILSTATNTGVEKACETLGRPVWYQLYPSSRWEVTEKLVKRAEAAKCPALVLTIDTQAGRHTETLERAKLLDTRKCVTCHGNTREDFYRRKPMFEGLDVKGLSTSNQALSWEHVRRLKSMSGMKLLIKGIETKEDAELCIANNVDGIIVSNHGGRAEESGRGTIECLPEVIEGARGKVPVLIDGGFRRGTDIYKALALGARAVFVGRPYIWGLAGFGQPGVERVIDILRLELELVMKQCGTPSISMINKSSVMFADRKL